MEITLYHYFNFKTFKRHFPNAIFLGFEYGFYKPSFSVNDQDWESNKSKLPKSCTVVKISKANNPKLTMLREKRAKKKYFYPGDCEK